MNLLGLVIAIPLTLLFGICIIGIFKFIKFLIGDINYKENWER